MKRVLITGASGFVGQRVCRQMVRRGYTVRAAVRSETTLTDLPPGVEFVRVPGIETQPDWRAALRGVSIVVHLVARTHQLGDAGVDTLPQYRAVNVQGTAHLLQACSFAKIERFIYMSSIKAVGEGSDRPYREEDPCCPEDSYGISKREAEEHVLAQRDFDTVILRPPLVYGSGAKGNLRRILGLIDRGIPLPVAGVRNQRSLVQVDNLASAVAEAAEHPAAAGQIFHVADDRAVSTAELVRHLAAGLSRPARLFHVPTSLLRLGGVISGQHEQVRRLVDSLTVSTTKIQSRLGWRPSVSIDEGLREMAEEYLREHHSQSLSTGQRAAYPQDRAMRFRKDSHHSVGPTHSTS